MASPRERDYRAPTSSADARLTSQVDPRAQARADLRPARQDFRGPVWPERPPPRRHHFHDVPPWPHQHYHDYVYVDRGGWWPAWYPYWDPGWYAYWWQLYDYYGGDAYAEYAEYARDAFLRQNAPQWGLSIGGVGLARQTTVGIQPYGVPAPSARYSPRGFTNPDQVAAYRSLALDQARRIQQAVNRVLIGYRDSPWGSELTIFGSRDGLRRWANEQNADGDVWYAAAFDLSASLSPISEVAR